MNDTPDAVVPAPRPSRRKPFLVGCLTGMVAGPVLIVALAVAGSFLFSDYIIAQKRARLKSPSITTGTAADYSLTVKTPDGKSLNLGELRGQTVFLHFWSPNCVECLSELSGLRGLHQSVKDDNVAFLAVAVGGFDELDEAVTREGVDFPVYTCADPLPEMYQGGVPMTFILSPSGQVAMRHPGAANWDTPAVAALLGTLAATKISPAAR